VKSLEPILMKHRIVPIAQAGNSLDIWSSRRRQLPRS
jgi:hypothetical protein